MGVGAGLHQRPWCGLAPLYRNWSGGCQGSWWEGSGVWRDLKNSVLCYYVL
jgi:hypothetical protein